MAAAETEAADSTLQRIGVFNQLVRFVVIGAGCAIPDYGTYMLLANLGLPAGVAKAIGFILGTTASYLINRRYTFHGASTGNTKAKALGFALVYGVTFFVNTGTTQLMASTLPEFTIVWGDQIRYTVCWGIGQGLGTLINFVMLKLVVFRE